MQKVGVNPQKAASSDIDPEVIKRSFRKRFPNMTEEQVARATDSYIMQAQGKNDRKPSDETDKYVNKIRKEQLERVEKIQSGNMREEVEDEKKTCSIWDMIHEIAKIYRKTYPKITTNQVLHKTHTYMWKSQGGRLSNPDDGSYGYWGKTVAEYAEKMRKGEYVLRKQKKNKKAPMEAKTTMQKAMTSGIDPEAIQRLYSKRFPNMTKEQVVKATNEYILQTQGRNDRKPSDETAKYVDKMRKEQLEYVEKIRERKGRSEYEDQMRRQEMLRQQIQVSDGHQSGIK